MDKDIRNFLDNIQGLSAELKKLGVLPTDAVDQYEKALRDILKVDAKASIRALLGKSAPYSKTAIQDVCEAYVEMQEIALRGLEIVGGKK